MIPADHGLKANGTDKLFAPSYTQMELQGNVGDVRFVLSVSPLCPLLLLPLFLNASSSPKPILLDGNFILPRAQCQILYITPPEGPGFAVNV